MTTIYLRQDHPEGLSILQIDSNFSNLNDNKLEISDAVSTNTAEKVVKRDSSGNFSANTITANLNGAATNIAGGGVGYIPYQSAADTTVLLAPGTSGYALISNGAAAPSWQKITAGAQGGSDTNAVFFENDQVVTADYTISANKNAGSFGPVTVNNGVTVTIPSGSTWTIA